MKLSAILSFGALAGLGAANTSQDVKFLTAFVSDYASNRKQYVDYFRTARDVPAALTKLAVQVVTYTDDSYTTMVKDPNVEITSLMVFATGLPWYTRLEANGLSISGLSEASGLSTPHTSASSGGSRATLLAPGAALIGGVALLLL